MTPIRADQHHSTPFLTGRARPTAVAVAVATALGVFLAPDSMAQSASASDVQELKSEVQRLQRKIDQLETQQAQTTAASAAAAPAPKAASSAPVVKAGPVTLTFGGYMALEAVYRDKNETADIGSNYNSAIPYTYQANAHISEFRESARQSRFSLLAQGPKAGGWSGEGYLESDFLSAGTSSNSTESNSYTLRVRHFFGVLRQTDQDWYLLAGQTWSLATLYTSAELNPRSERVPLTIDAQYVAGFNWTRNAQIRFVKNFGKLWSFGVSAESPQTSFYTGCSGVATPAPTGCGSSPSSITTNAGGSLLNSAANYSIDFAPDVIAKLAFDPGWGHYEVYGLGRGFRDRSPGTAAGTNNTTWAGSIGAGMILPLAPGLEFQLSGLAGHGNGRYGSAQITDATIRPDGTVAAIREWQALAGIVYKPVPALQLYVYAGEEKASRTAYSNAAGTSAIGYGSDLYNNSGCYSLTGSAATCIANTESVENVTVGEWWKVYTGEIGNFQVGLEYNWLERKAFGGVGGAPVAPISMGFVSFRWYPYQK